MRGCASARNSLEGSGAAHPSPVLSPQRWERDAHKRRCVSRSSRVVVYPALGPGLRRERVNYKRAEIPGEPREDSGPFSASNAFSSTSPRLCAARGFSADTTKNPGAWLRGFRVQPDLNPTQRRLRSARDRRSRRSWSTDGVAARAAARRGAGRDRSSSRTVLRAPAARHRAGWNDQT